MDPIPEGETPFATTIRLLGGKHKILVLWMLSSHGRMRFNELKRFTGEGSSRMLSITLRELESDGLISRTVVCESPQRVEYSLTTVGMSVLPVLEYLHRRSLTDDQRKLFVHFHDRRMDVSAYEPGKLLLHNTFRSTQGADVVYYLLYIWQQLGFDQQKDELYLIGRVPDQEHTLRELHRFLAEVAFIHPAAEFKRAANARGDADFEIQADFALS